MRTLSYKEYEELKLNSQMRHLMIQCLDNDALIEALKKCIKNCQYKVTNEPVTYDEAVFNSFIPELIKRIK